MSYKILFMGPPRTATCSLWLTLSDHPEIAVSKEKEPLNCQESRRKLDENPSLYPDMFRMAKQTKVLLDATAFPYHLNKQLVKGVIKAASLKPKIIFPLRNPFDRLYSTVKMMFVRKAFPRHNDTNEHMPSFMNTDPLDFYPEKIFESIMWWMDSEIIKDAFEITDDIFIFKFNQFEINGILRYLNVKPVFNKKLLHINACDEEWNRLEDIKNKVDLFFKKGTETWKKLNEIVRNEIALLNREYHINVEEWIQT